MKNVTVKFKKLYEDVELPKQAHPGDAGFDLSAYSCDNNIIFNTAVLKPGERKLFKCGFSMAVPNGFEAQVRSRSGLALKQGVMILNSPGTIDSGYRGEIGVILINHSTSEVTVKKGDRIAQMVVAEVPVVEFKEVDDLDSTERNTGGFGSSGN